VPIMTTQNSARNDSALAGRSLPPRFRLPLRTRQRDRLSTVVASGERIPRCLTRRSLSAEMTPNVKLNMARHFEGGGKLHPQTHPGPFRGWNSKAKSGDGATRSSARVRRARHHGPSPWRKVHPMAVEVERERHTSGPDKLFDASHDEDAAWDRAGRSAARSAGDFISCRRGPNPTTAFSRNTRCHSARDRDRFPGDRAMTTARSPCRHSRRVEGVEELSGL